MDQQQTKTGYAEVNGVKLYYEVHGHGEPLVLLHGGVVGIPMLASILPELARDRQVIAVELRGHGRSAEIEAEFSFEAMADDVAGVMEHLGIKSADAMGYSLGGNVVQQFVMRHPEKVRKLIIVSAAYKRSAWYPEILDAFEHMGPEAGEMMKQSPLAQFFPNLDWNVLFDKTGRLLRQDFDWSSGMAEVKSTTLLIFADADSIKTSHAAEYYELLGGGQRDAGLDGSLRPKNRLAILPGQTHYDIIGSPTLVRVVTDFLDAPDE